MANKMLSNFTKFTYFLRFLFVFATVLFAMRMCHMYTQREDDPFIRERDRTSSVDFNGTHCQKTCTLMKSDDGEENKLFTAPHVEWDGKSPVVRNVTRASEDYAAKMRITEVLQIPFHLELEGFIAINDDIYSVFISNRDTKEKHHVLPGSLIPGTSYKLVRVYRKPIEQEEDGGEISGLKAINYMPGKACAVVDNGKDGPVAIRLHENSYIDTYSITVECSLGGKIYTHKFHGIGECVSFQGHQYCLTDILHSDNIAIFMHTDLNTGRQVVFPLCYEAL